MLGYQGGAMSKDAFLTRAWNNRLTAMLGIPAFIWAVLALMAVFSDLNGFIGMVGFAVVF